MVCLPWSYMGSKQNLTENLSPCWLSFLSVRQLLFSTFSLMIIVITVQVSMFRKKTIRKGPSSSIQGTEEFFFRSLPSSNFFLHVEGHLNPFNGWNEAAYDVSSMGCWGLLHTSICGPCCRVCCCTDSYVQLTLSTWCGAQLSKVRVVVNGPADDCLDMTPPICYWELQGWGSSRSR